MSALPIAEHRPVVTVAIPVLDEEGAIGECLDRVRAQTWPDLEVVVADGGSTDRTRELVLAAAAHDPRIRLVDNPRRLQSAGLNEVLSHSDAEVVVRLDARSFVSDDYVERCVELLRGTGAAVVGGRMVARREGGAVGRGIARANASWWGAGPARFHQAGAAGPAETVYLGAFDRRWLDRVGGWSEDVGVNEDYELNHRIRAEGGEVWLEPALEVGYRARRDLRALARQYARYGRSKATVMRRHPASVRARQVAPVLLVPAALVATAPGRPGRAARLLLLGHVAAVVALAGRGDEPAGERAASGLAALVMHWAWACGWWSGLARPFGRAR